MVSPFNLPVPSFKAFNTKSSKWCQQLSIDNRSLARHAYTPCHRPIVVREVFLTHKRDFSFSPGYVTFVPCANVPGAPGTLERGTQRTCFAVKEMYTCGSTFSSRTPRGCWHGAPGTLAHGTQVTLPGLRRM